MQRVSQTRSSSARASSARPAGNDWNVIATVDSPIDDERGQFPKSLSQIPKHETQDRAERQRALEVAIIQRIETRLRGRVRDLSVRVIDDVVFLQGKCATYYTKQLAQHAAMGIIDDEQLENEIVVVAH
ncbi:MAG TPA: BON domain-containing protein [Lacipirellulaceae bacterium]|nr:BON domain-containing protein [Lacipirellulaceae bacterium]